MKRVENHSEIKVGDRIRILKEPSSWGSYLKDRCGLNQKFPIEITVKELGTSPMGYPAMTCGEYGWNLKTVIEAGCELLNVELQELPKKWYVRGSEDLKNHFTTQSTMYSGNDVDLGYWKTSFGWDFECVEVLSKRGYQELSWDDFKKFILNQNKQINKTTEIMQNTTAKKQKSGTYFNKENQIVKFRTDGTSFTVDIVKETSTVRVIPVQSVSYARKDKLKENPITTTLEREVVISVIADDEGQVYTGYAIKNPNDEKVSENLGRDIARNRAINPRTNLSPYDLLSQNFISKQILKGVAETFFERISKGSIIIEGVK